MFALQRQLDEQFVRARWYGEVHVGVVRQVSEYAETMRTIMRIFLFQSPAQSLLTMDSVEGIAHPI